MAAPTSPYCTSQQVAYLVKQLFPGQITAPDFSASSVPSLTEVNAMIDHICAEVEMTLASMGYKVPFIAWNGEGWPEFQTSWLTMICATGAAGLVCQILLPAPAMGGEGGHGQGNIYAQKYNDMLQWIRNGAGIRFRADCWPNTEAYKKLRLQRGPMTDWSEQRVDAADFTRWSDLAVLYGNVFEEYRQWAGGFVDKYSLDIPTAYGMR